METAVSLDFLKRDNELKNHVLIENAHVGSAAPSVIYEKRPVIDADGKPVEDLYSAWITLNNPAQYNSYTTEMVKGVIEAFQNASSDRSVVAAVFTASGDKAWCSGGNTSEYASYYARRPQEYGDYIDLFIGMVDGILNCKKPVICRVNGMRVAGGQEIGMATDITISSDMAVYGQAGPKHGSAPVGGSTDFLPWFLSMEDAIYNCVSCELWSAYKMKYKGMISKVLPVLKKNGEWIPNPKVRTDTWSELGQIVYGEMVQGEALAHAEALIAQCKVDFELLDKEVNALIWRFTNLFPNCLMNSIDAIRGKKKFFWDQQKAAQRHWLAANMNNEAWLGFNAFESRKITGKDTVDFVKYRQLLAKGAQIDEHFAEQVLAAPR